MILNEEQIDEMQEMAKPLIKWLNDNAHPHTKIIVEWDGAEIERLRELNRDQAARIFDYENANLSWRHQSATFETNLIQANKKLAAKDKLIEEMANAFNKLRKDIYVAAHNHMADSSENGNCSGCIIREALALYEKLNPETRSE